jgi:hypothetical protein
VVTELAIDIDQELTSRYGTPASDARIARTAAALEANGFVVLRAGDAAAARDVVLNLIPEAAEVHHGASRTLELTGIADALESSGRFLPLRPRVRSMDRATQADEIRRLSTAPEVMLGSVHATTDNGELLVASSSGSQLAAYVAGAGRVILVVGSQKIVADLAEGLQRINDYAYPLEDARAFEAYGIRSSVNKLLIINREIVPGRITVVLIDEAIGF